ncbi:MAG: type IX secretion system sortase PorU [Prevotella sp.]|nr:type IX secretion system sortase PorU [Prevotella sp.]
MKRILAIAATLLWVLTMAGQAGRFVNLTAEEVKIADSVLPRVAYSFALPEGYQDSVYTVRLLYPDFIDADSDLEVSLPAMPIVEQRVVVSRRKGSLEASFCPYVCRDGRYQILVSFMLKVESSPLQKGVRRASKVGPAAQAAERYAAHSVLATGRWAKIRVPSTGVYQLTESLIRQAGFSDPGKVKVYGYGGALQAEALSGDKLAELDDLKEVPTCTVNGRRLFHAVGTVTWTDSKATRRTRNPYSDYGYYFLTQSDEAPATVDEETFLSSFYPSPDYYHTLYEKDGYSWYHGGRNLYDSEQITTQSPKQIILTNTGGSENGRLSVCLSSGSAARAQVLFNGKELGTMAFSIPDQYTMGDEERANYDVKGLHAQDTVKIVCLQGGPLRLDYVSMAWEKATPAPDLQSASFPTPEYVYNITNQDHHADGPADMVIIIPTSQKLLSQAERIKKLHEDRDSLRVTIVPADELYNEFASGTPDANAYRRYLKMLYDRAADESDLPRYLLLFGDGVWDNRMLTPDCASLDPDDYLLCVESENSLHKVYCYVDDGFFGLLDDGEGADPQSSDKLDLAVGRFPVTTPDEAKVMVDKTIAYAENKNAGAWQNTLVFMGDDGDSNRHMRDLNDAAEDIASRYPGYLVKKIIWDAYTRESTSTGYRYPEVTRLIKQYQASGALIMDYAGHGSELQISHESVLRASDFAAFSNTNLPLWITASCDIMPFDGVGETIGEIAVLNKKGGAVAFFGTTRTVYADRNKSINMAYLRHVLSKPGGNPVTIGEAQRLAKNELIETGTDRTTNKLQYSLLGDPALALNMPTMQVIVDSINGLPTTSLASMKAGGVVKVDGHIESSEGFTGVISATVRDSKEQIICKLNDTREADNPFTYYDRTNTLFQGTDSVVNGKFSFRFAVPKDINYTDETGLMNLHAVSSDHQLLAHGQSEAFRVGGSDLQGSDEMGPNIYCYLNSPSFVNGGRVNATPYFVAQLSDQDGINAAGSGIGHDMQLTIDGDVSRTYVLNDNFSFDFGTYTSGSTHYSIPELEDGIHRLQFRAWDVLNNSSTAELDFVVARHAEPNIYSIGCTQNPASSQTTFIMNHDRTGSSLDVEVEVLDVSGRLLWRHEESGVSADSAYTVDWDLCVDGGRRLQTGVYLYRVRIECDGSSHLSKAKKLIVL